MFRLLARGAYPHAGLQLIEALRDYERAIELHPVPEDRYRYMSRNRSEFSWHQILDEFCSDPLESQCLHRSNWLKVRPELYVSTYVTERDNFVIEVRPCLTTGFKYGGMTYIDEQGDFQHFPIFSPGFGRPTNRMLYICLGSLARSFCSNDPWTNHQSSGIHQADERKLIMLATQAKLHQLSLYFDCFLGRELIQFGAENFIDFREPPGDQDPKHKFSPVHSMEYFNQFDSARWAPPRIREHLAASNLTVPELYKFATEYLASVDKQNQARTYAQYLGCAPSHSITDADVSDLLNCARDKDFRASSLLAELAVDSSFTTKMKGPHQFDYFCRNFNLTEQDGLEWVALHHPAAVAFVGRLSIAALIHYLKKRRLPAHTQAREQVDRQLAEVLARDESFKWSSSVGLPDILNAEAIQHGFVSFDAFQLWAKKAAPLTWAVSVERADRVAQHLALSESEAAAKRQASKEKRKATLAAKKAAASGAKS